MKSNDCVQKACMILEVKHDSTTPFDLVNYRHRYHPERRLAPTTIYFMCIISFHSSAVRYEYSSISLTQHQTSLQLHFLCAFLLRRRSWLWLLLLALVVGTLLLRQRLGMGSQSEVGGRVLARRDARSADSVRTGIGLESTPIA